MADFTGKYKQISSDNFGALLKEMGATDDIINRVANQTQELEITKNGNVFTYKSVTPERTHEFSFELGKEFDESRPDGKTVKSIVVSDGNKWVQTTKGEKELKVVRELQGNDLRTTATVGSVVAVRVYTRV
ncbi:unnamed protein product [Oppiella nova]|uniref:Lipocalin/cytosolic fatty-acid binding domain-containing protein n=1 Tax=Oppiella nova TaxID=334625 RepID=A0A7R9M5Q8_9ACAR|nr:unnamed protein product [Oppiella nova]CAG2171170.1 unnamed protein product [Oppiella nova]